jgi:hypothetical protein
MGTNHFPPPWSIEDLGACFVVKDGGGQKLAYVYYEEEPGRRSSAKLLTKDEARRIAANWRSCRREIGSRTGRDYPSAELRRVKLALEVASRRQ